MILRRFSVVVLPFALHGCQPPAPLVLAMEEDGTIVFHAREQGMLVDRIFGWDDAAVDVSAFAVEVEGKPVWQLMPGKTTAGCVRRTTFPVRYGEARCGMATAKARPLEAGRRYDVRLGSEESGKWWSGGIVASFRVRSGGGVDNIRPYE